MVTATATPTRRRTPKAAATPFALAAAVVPHEAEEQKALMRWAAQFEWLDARLALLFHVPNGGMRDVRVAKKLKAEGVKRGVPDVFLPVIGPPGMGLDMCDHGLFIELKRLKGGALSPEQRWWIDRLRAQGYRVEVCKGWLAAALVIAEHLGLPADTVPAV